MRSRKVCPGSAVTLTTIRSESTFVPPVTADRSPPDSRMTGADSPVIADSSTDAMPSVISPSEGIRSPASQTTRSPLASAAAATNCSVPSGRSLRASVSERILRSVSAWALPLPSAIASAKLAKIEGQEQPDRDGPVEKARMRDRLDEGDHRADENNEHHRVADLHPGVELLEGADDRLAEDLAVEEASRLGHTVGHTWRRVPSRDCRGGACAAAGIS